MGKKHSEPEPEKIIRKLGENLSIEVSENEKKYRNRNGPDDINEIRKDKLKCTVCTKSVADIVKKGVEPFVHMVLGVLMCKSCASFYGDGYFSVDEDGDDKYCRWCGQGGTLYLCSSCSCAFCKKCIKQNLSKNDVKDLESDDWKCFICNPKPLFECRTVCWALQEHASKYKNDEKMEEEKDEEEEPLSNARSKRDKGKRDSKSESSGSRKRKASDTVDEPDIERKRRKSSDTEKGSKQEQSKDKLRRSSHRASTTEKEEEKTEEHSRSQSRSKQNKSFQHIKELTVSKRPSRNSKNQETSKKIEEVVISDEDEKPLIKESPRKSRKSRNEQEEQEETKQERPKRSSGGNSTKDKKDPEIETPSKKSRSSDKKSSPRKKSNSKSTKSSDKTPVKRSQRATKSTQSHIDDSGDESSKLSDSALPLFSLGDNSASESESKTKTSKTKSRGETKLPMAKNADDKVKQAGGYISSALKDVKELSVLIASRCERLCCKSVQTNEDVLSVFSKLKQLMGGVHTNLELIEKGLDTKINGWKENTKEGKEVADDGKEGESKPSNTEPQLKETFPCSDESKTIDSLEPSKTTDKIVVVEEKDQYSEKEEEKMEIDVKSEHEQSADANDEGDTLDAKVEIDDRKTSKLNKVEKSPEKENDTSSCKDNEANEETLHTSENEKEQELESVENQEKEVDKSKESQEDIYECTTDETVNASQSTKNSEEDDTNNENNQKENVKIPVTVDDTSNAENECGEMENGNICETSRIEGADEEKSNDLDEEKQISNSVLSDCKTTSQKESLDSVFNQSSMVTASENNCDAVSKVKDDKVDILCNAASDGSSADVKEEESPLPENLEAKRDERLSESISETKNILSFGEGDSLTTPTKPMKESEELRNGSVEKKRKDSTEKEKDNKDSESRPENKEVREVSKTPSYDRQSNSKSQSYDSSRSHSGERSRFPHQQAPHRNRDGDYHRFDRYQDRSGYDHGGSRRGGFDGRRSNRSGWGWNR